MDINIIKTAPWNTRASITDESVRPLAESIRADGLIQPIGVCHSEDGTGYICFDGNRRLAACRLLGMTDIAATVHDCTIEEAMIKTVTANLQREDDEPLLAAAVIAGIGGDPEVIATKLGKPTAWVRRRAKLNALTDEICALAGSVTLEVLERVSDLSADDQRKLAKRMADRVKWSNGNRLRWIEVRGDVNALTEELDAAPFDTAGCAACTERTGAEWFADGESGLGRCLNCACFKAKVRANEQEQIAALGDCEKVRIDYEWQMPREARDDAGDKKTKKHPCAYYWFEHGEIKVRWAKSKSAIDAERKEHEAKREAELAAESESRARYRAVCDSLSEWFAEDNESEVRKAIAPLVNCGSEERNALLADALTMWLCSYHDVEEYALVVRLLPDAVKAAGVGDEDAKWFVGEAEEC